MPFQWDEVETFEERAVRLTLEKSNAKRAELIPTLKEGETICNHLDPHVIPVFEGAEAEFRIWCGKMGWFNSGGYCPAYYPMWLRHAYRLMGHKGLPVLKEEPLAFGEGGEWEPPRN